MINCMSYARTKDHFAPKARFKQVFLNIANEDRTKYVKKIDSVVAKHRKEKVFAHVFDTLNMIRIHLLGIVNIFQLLLSCL